MTRFSKKNYPIQNVCFNFLYDFGWNISHSKKTWARYDEKRKFVFMESTRYSCRILMKILFKSHENPPTWSRVVARGQTGARTDRQTDMMNLTVASRNIMNAPRNCRAVYISIQDGPYIYLKRKLL